MTEVNENSHITLNIYNNQKDSNIYNSKFSSQTNNPNMLEYMNKGISKQFPDNMRNEENNRTDFPIKEMSNGNNNLQTFTEITETTIIGNQQSNNLTKENIKENHINNVQPISFIQKNDMNTNNMKNAQAISSTQKNNAYTDYVNYLIEYNKKKYCCGKCSEKDCCCIKLISCFLCVITVIVLALVIPN